MESIVLFPSWFIIPILMLGMNYQRKNVSGFSLDFAFLNLYGFICYSIYNIAFYYSSTIKNEYEDQWSGAKNTVQLNDVVFSVHAAIISLLIVIQTYLRSLPYRPDLYIRELLGRNLRTRLVHQYLCQRESLLVVQLSQLLF
jgi:hypothetical protein